MATTQVQPVVAAAAASVPETTLPRKRRRRVPASGAADDCFACRKRNTKCDRKRPYCSQCLAIGKECSGYKTTLTWGVGIASRGKLRGMSCPVPQAQQKPQSAPTSEPSPSTTSPKSSSATGTSFPKYRGASYDAQARRREQQSIRVAQAKPPTSNPMMSPIRDHQLSSSTVHTHGLSRNGLTMSDAIPIPTSSGQGGWSMQQHQQQQLSGQQQPQQQQQPPSQQHQAPSYLTHNMGHDISGSRHRPAGLHRLLTSRSLYDDQSNMSASVSSVGSCSSYADSAFGSPLEYPSTPEPLSFSSDQLASPYGDSSVGLFEGLSYYDSTIGSPTVSVKDEISSIASSDQSILDPLDGKFSVPDSMYNFNNTLDFSSLSPMHPLLQTTTPIESRTSSVHHSLSNSIFSLIDNNKDSCLAAANPMLSPASTTDWSNLSPFGIGPRMQYLLDYYDKAICPIMVAYDGPHNPYRVHVVSLATHNLALQNAVAALSLNNIRKRTESNLANAFDAAPALAEETHYKAMSVQLLDAQLKLPDPNMASDDAILVTLLILCLYHVCDSGVSQFKTQLAGVQKLLSLRQHNLQRQQQQQQQQHPQQRSEVLDWVQMYFAWFDVMTATVNEREIEIECGFLNLNDLQADLQHFDEFTGCDGRLFKLIARLSRLNLLAQGRPVKRLAEPTFQGMLASLGGTPPASSLQPALGQIKTSPPGKDYYSLDGNGWHTPVTTPPPSNPPTTSMLASAQPDRAAFWAEWTEIHERLQAWQYDPPSTAQQSITPPTTTTVAHTDLHNVSHAFHAAAQLYTQRLALPHQASAHPEFQALVERGLRCVNAIPMDSCVRKFLLWPLFVLGTECVEEGQRTIIRRGWEGIHAGSGFFNNIVVGEVLEGVWAGKGPAKAGELFRWRGAMDRTDGEYIII